MNSGISTFLLGLGLGFGLGMALAPRSGRETRELLRTKAGEGADYMSQRTSEMADRASDLVERGRQAVEDQKENLAGVAEAGRQIYQKLHA